MYAAPRLLETEIFTSLPASLRVPERNSAWVARRGAGPLHSFLEGPSFDRDGNLYCVDVAHGRIFRIAPDGEWQVFAEYDGIPNGLKIHRDGRIFITDRQRGLLSFDPVSAKRTVVLDHPHGEGFKALNDLVFASNGDLYFTDPGESSLYDRTGRVWRLRASGELDLLCDKMEGPNGLVLNKDETALLVGVTLINAVVRVPVRAGQGAGRAGIFIRLSGSPAGPDGLALDEQGNIVVVHAGCGTVWLFSRMGEPLYRIKSCAGMRVTNVAYGGPDRRTLFITEAEQGVLLKVALPVAGEPMFALR
jgi:gluconolactonase